MGAQGIHILTMGGVYTALLALCILLYTILVLYCVVGVSFCCSFGENFSICVIFGLVPKLGGAPAGPTTSHNFAIFFLMK